MNEPDRDARGEDRLVDIMLDEACGDARPPDLEAEILRRLAQPETFDVATETPETTASRAPLRPMLLAAAAGVLLGVGIGMWRGPRDVEVRIETVSGSVVYETPRHSVSIARASAADVQMRVGDRIRSEPGGTVRLRPFGTLTLNQRSCVEIESMEWTKRDGILVSGSLVFGAVAGAFAWDALDTRTGVEAHEMDPETRTNSEADLQVSELRAQIAKLQQDNEELRVAAERTRVADAAIESEPAPDGSDAESPERALEPLQTVGFNDQLAAIDWALTGRTCKDLLPLLAQLGDALANGEDPSLEQIAEIHKLNALLIQHAGELAAADVAGVGPNGAFTHPAAAGNRVMATLAAAGLDLNDDQRRRLSDLMNQYGSIDEGIRISEASEEFKLTTLLAEVDYKKKFFDEMRGLLTADQASAVTSDRTNGRLNLGLYGPGLVLSQFASPTTVSDPGHMTSTYASRLRRTLGLTGEASTQLGDVVSSWVRELPDSFWENRGDDLEVAGMLHADRVIEAAHRQHDLMQRVVARFGSQISEESRRALAEQLEILVPLPR